MTLPDSITALPKRASELRDLLIRWCNQNSGSASPAGLAAMLKLLQAEFGHEAVRFLEESNLLDEGVTTLAAAAKLLSGKADEDERSHETRPADGELERDATPE